MRKSVAFIAKSGQGHISTKSTTAKPYFTALKSCDLAVDQIELGMHAKDERMLKGLNSLGPSVTQLSASWGVLRKTHSDLEVGRGVIALSKSYELYNAHYGPAAARKHQGGKVSAEESSRLTKCRTDSKKFRGQLMALKSKAPANSSALRFVADLLYLCDSLDRISGNDLNSYCRYSYEFDRLRYSIYGYGNVVQAWYPGYYSQWSSASTYYSSMSTSFSSQSWSSYESWNYTSQSISNYSNYYEATSAVSSITQSDISSISASTRSYDEEAATVVSKDELAAINEEVTVDEDQTTTFADEVSKGIDDEDADGVTDETETDDDNDGVADETDKDDDGDGVPDAEDTKEIAEEDSAEEDSGDEEEMTEEDSAEEDSAEEDSADEDSGDEDSGDEEEMTEEDSAEEDSAEEDFAEEDSGEEDSGGGEEMAEGDSGGGEEDSSGADDSGGGEDQ